MHPAVGIVVGIIAMVGGMAWHLNPGPMKEVYEKLEHQGLPLDLGKTIAVIGVFLILFPVINSFFVKPLNDAINARTTELESTFSEAESLRNEMTHMKGEYEQRLTATEADARQKIQDEIRKAQDLRAQLQNEAAAQKEEMIKRAEEEIATQRDRTIRDLRLNTVNLTLGATEKLIGRRLSADDDTKLIEEFIANAEVPA